MMRGFRIGVLLSLSLLSAGIRTPPASAETYTVKNARIKVTLVPEKPSYLQGEPIRLIYTITNLSNHTVDILPGVEPFDIPIYTGFQFRAVRNDGLLVLPPLQQRHPTQTSDTVFWWLRWPPANPLSLLCCCRRRPHRFRHPPIL